MEATAGVIIRSARPEDMAAMHEAFVTSIWKIDDSFYDQTQKQAWVDAIRADSWMTRMLELDFIVAVIKEEVVGFASWSNTKLEHLYVNAKFNRLGIGSALMKEILSHFDERAIELVASNNAHRFYLKFGFVDEEFLIKQLGLVDVSCIRMKRPAV